MAPGEGWPPLQLCGRRPHNPTEECLEMPMQEQHEQWGLRRAIIQRERKNIMCTDFNSHSQPPSTHSLAHPQHTQTHTHIGTHTVCQTSHSIHQQQQELVCSWYTTCGYKNIAQTITVTNNSSWAVKRASPPLIYLQPQC